MPKGTGFKKFAIRDIVEMANLINNRPKKEPQMEAPLEAYRSQGIALEELE